MKPKRDQNDDILGVNAQVDNVIGEYDPLQRSSVTSNNTFVTSTTRSSSVMPQAKHNLGLTDSVTGDMNADEIYSLYGHTSVAQKNIELTGNLPLSKEKADALNEVTNLKQNIYIKNKMLSLTKPRSKKPKKRRKIVFLILISVVGVVLIGAIIGVAVGNKGEDDPGEDTLVTEAPIDFESLSVEILRVSEKAFESLCTKSERSFDKTALCVSDEAAIFCEEGQVRPVTNECSGCNVCSGLVVQDLDCSSNSSGIACDSQLELPIFDEMKAEEITKVTNLSSDCLNSNDQPDQVCSFTDDVFLCFDDTVDMFGCIEPCQENDCVSVSVPLPEVTDISSNLLFSGFCALIENGDDVFRCRIENDLEVARSCENEVRNCDPGFSCICGEDGVFNVNDADVICVETGSNLDEFCPVLSVDVDPDGINNVLGFLT